MEGKKFDDNKVRYELIPPDALALIAEVFTLGAKKYGARNWEHGLDQMRLYAALKRHGEAWHRGEDLDPETGKPHLAHLGCTSLMLLAIFLRRPDLDDRPLDFLKGLPLKRKEEGVGSVPVQLSLFKEDTSACVRGIFSGVFDEADAGMGVD